MKVCNRSCKSGVLILSPFYHPNVGGVETHLQNLTYYLRKIAVSTYVVTYMPLSGRAPAKFYEKENCLEIWRAPWLKFDLFNKLEKFPLLEFLYLSPAFFILAFVFLCFKGRKIKTIHAHGLNAALVGLLLSRLFFKKIIVSIHAIYEKPPDSFFSRLTSYVLKSVDAVLTLSGASKNELIRMGLSGDKIKVYTYWIEQEIFKVTDKKSAKEKLGWPGKFIVLFVGRFIEKKGVDILIAAAEIVREIKDIHFVFIGVGPLAPLLKDRATESSNLIYVGRVDNVDLTCYYNAADILCVPSKYEEGFGRVILEALSCGLPVIASNRGGMPEIINDKVGILVEPNPEDFKVAIISLYKNSLLREKLSLNAGVHARERFSDSNAKIIVDCYAV